MTRRLFVHMGPRKTGTTAIQGVLRSLNSEVVIYPKVGLWGDGSHHGLVFAYFGENRAPRGKPNRTYSADRLFEKLAREAGHDKRDVIISSEALSTGRDFESFISALLPYLDIRRENVKVLLGCREHFSRVASLFNHRMRASAERRTPDEFLCAIAGKMCYRPLIQALRDSGFQTELMSYHPSDTWVMRFFQHLRISDHELPAVRWKNVALSPKGLVVMLAVSQFATSWQQKKTYIDLLRNAIPDVRSPSGFIFGQDAALEADRQFSDDRAFIASTFGISLPKPDLRTENCGLKIGVDELAQIEEVARQFGDEGRQIVDFASRFCRQTSTAPCAAS